MTLEINTREFIEKSIDRNLKQAHLNDNYVFSLTDDTAAFPSNIKTLIKKTAESGFLTKKEGVMFVVFAAKDASTAKDSDKLKIERLMKTTFFVDPNSGYSSESIYKIQEEGKKKKVKESDEEAEDAEDDDSGEEEESNESVNPIYYITKIEIKK